MFPRRFGSAESEALRFHQQQQRRTLALCAYLATGQARHLQELALLEAWLLDQTRPELFDEGHVANVLTLARRQFGATVAALAAQGFARADELSLFAYHSAIEYLSDKHAQA